LLRGRDHAVDVVPPCVLANERASLVEHSPTGVSPVVRAEFDDPLAIERSAVGRDNFEAHPRHARIQVETSWSCPRVPRREQIVHIADRERGVARAHQCLRSRSDAAAMQPTAAIGVGVTGAARAAIRSAQNSTVDKVATWVMPNRSYTRRAGTLK